MINPYIAVMHIAKNFLEPFYLSDGFLQAETVEGSIDLHRIAEFFCGDAQGMMFCNGIRVVHPGLIDKNIVDPVGYPLCGNEGDAGQ